MPQALLLAAVVGCGGLLGLQARVNGELSGRLHSALAAATVSFLGGLVVLVAAVGAFRRHRTALRRARAEPTRWWWWLFGGLGGAGVVSATAEGVPRVGVALVTVCVVAGIAVGALAVDEAGLGPGGRQPVTTLRLSGALLAVGAVALGAIGAHTHRASAWLFALVFAAGALSALQPAANGRLRAAAQSAWFAGLVSFAVGTAALLAAVLVRGDFAGRHWPGTWWLYTGGPDGVVFIVVTAAVVHRLGVLAVSLATVAGQLAAAVVLDAAWPTAGTTLRPLTVVGAALTFVAVAVVGRRPAPAARGHDGDRRPAP